jgi:hypothetical protein
MPANFMDRRTFGVAWAYAMLGGAAIAISGCGSGSPTSSSSDKAGVVSDNHGHVAVITSAQLDSGGGLTLGIQGSADHPHTVELTAAEIVAIRSGSRTAKQSSTALAHNHTVTFN